MEKSERIILLTILLELLAIVYLLLGNFSIQHELSNRVLSLLKQAERKIAVFQNPERYSAPYSCIDCNVILLSVDTLRADHLGSYGYSRNTSPHMDELASNGILFQNAFSQSPNTLPSHMSMFTSLYPITHRVITSDNDALDFSMTTLPEILKQYNYKAAWFAPTDGLHLNVSKGLERGFDEFYVDLNNANDWDLAYNWIGSNMEKKFFMFLHTSQTHDPYIVPSPFDKLYDTNYQGSIIGEVSEFFAQYEQFKEERAVSPEEEFLLLRKFYWQFVDTLNENDVNYLIALYDAAITCCIDPYVGELMDTLRKYNIDEKTIIIITSDHGESFGEHGNFLHNSLHYEDLRIPLIVVVPNKEKKVVDSQVQSIDIMPTILDIVGIPSPDGIQGKSLMQLVRGEIKNVNEYTYSYWVDVSSIRSDEWKLIRYNNRDVELYNVKDDPRELVNVAEQYPDVAEDMKNKLDEFELSPYIR